MKKTKRFPSVIYVAWESPDRDEPYLAVRLGGVFDSEEPNEPVAIYKLESVGRVEIRKRFVKP